MREIRAEEVRLGMVVRTPGEPEGRVVSHEVRGDDVLIALELGQRVVDVPALGVDDMVEVIDP